MKEDAKQALALALQEEDLCVENVMGNTFVGNQDGLYHVRMSARVQAMEDKFVSFGEELSQQKKKNEEEHKKLEKLEKKLSQQKTENEKKLSQQKTENEKKFSQQKKKSEEEHKRLEKKLSQQKKKSEEEHKRLEKKLSQQKTENEKKLSQQKTENEKKFSQQIKKNEGEHKKHQKKNDHEFVCLRSQILHLTTLSREYMLVRNRFISAFKRKKLGIKDDLDIEIISEGNKAAHAPDVITDATLYTPNTVLAQRVDKDIFKQLYGLLPEQASTLSEYQLLSPLQIILLTYSEDTETISILNTHAGIVSSQKRPPSTNFSRLFSSFIKLLEQLMSNGSYYEDRESRALNDAGEAFLACAKREGLLVAKAE